MRLRLFDRFRKKPDIPLNITEAHFKDGKLDLALADEKLVEWFANAVESFWRKSDNPPNYIALTAWCGDDLGMMEMTVRKIDGKTPAELNMELKSQIEKLKARVEELEGIVPPINATVVQ